MTRTDRSRAPRFALLAALGLTLSGLMTPAAVATSDRALDEAQQLLDQGAAEQALATLDSAMRRGKPTARAYFLRSTARFMIGDHDIGVVDLREALRLDPTLRQGWINLAAVEMTVERYEPAHQALLEARKLAPDAPDNDLNLGAVLLFLDRHEEAESHFARYVARQPSNGEAALQVASNYALVAAVAPMIRYLEQAFAANERLRFHVRADAKFSFFHLEEFQRLMSTDRYQPPADAHQVQAAFPTPYALTDRRLIDAVTDALRTNDVTFEPTIEATERWALIWGDLRVKVTNQDGGTGVVALSAPAERYSAEDWHRQSQQLFKAIQAHLRTAEAARSMRSRGAANPS